MLSQKVQGVDKSVAYASRCLTKAERNYTATERECLAVVWAVRHFSVYLQGRDFKLITDHCPLTYLRRCKDPRGRLARWILELEQFSYTMEHRQGKSIPHADALSRAPPGEQESVDEHPDRAVPKLASSAEDGPVKVGEIRLGSDERELLVGQRCDSDLLLVIACLLHEKPCPADASPTVKFYLDRRESLSVDKSSGLLYWTGDNRRQLVVPMSSVKDVLALVHDSEFSGHLGVAKTLQKLKDRFFWRNMYDDTVSHLRSCVLCSQRKSPPKPLRANFGKMPVPSAPWHWISMDIAGPFPVTERGNKYILVVTCAFSKWVEAFPLPNQEASTIASILVDQLFCRYGCPSVIHSDQGRNFESNLMKEICRHLGIEKSRTSSYHPQGNGMVERFNGTVCSMLSMFVADDQKNWDTYLAKVTFAYNTSVHESTKETPFLLFMGREPRLPADVTCGAEGCAASSVLSEDKKQEIHRKVSESIRAAASRRAEMRAAHSHQVSYQVGDFVWLHNPVRKVGKSPKLCRPWTGPFQVVSVLSPVTYRIQLSGVRCRRRTSVVHHDRLKACVCREDEAYNAVPCGMPDPQDTPRESSDIYTPTRVEMSTTPQACLSEPLQRRDLRRASECSCDDIYEEGELDVATVAGSVSSALPGPASVEPSGLSVAASGEHSGKECNMVTTCDSGISAQSGPIPRHQTTLSVSAPVAAPVEHLVTAVADDSAMAVVEHGGGLDPVTAVQSQGTDPYTPTSSGPAENLVDPASALRRSGRQRREPQRYGEWDFD